MMFDQICWPNARLCYVNSDDLECTEEIFSFTSHTTDDAPLTVFYLNFKKYEKNICVIVVVRKVYWNFKELSCCKVLIKIKLCFNTKILNYCSSFFWYNSTFYNTYFVHQITNPVVWVTNFGCWIQSRLLLSRHYLSAIRGCICNMNL